MEAIQCERNYKIDNIKAILIFLVVFGHILELFDGRYQRILYLKIYSFHMPAFVYTTGYFAKLDPRNAFSHFLHPYIVYQTLYFAFQRFVLHRHVFLQYTTPYWLMWYLLSCFFWQLLLPAFATVNEKQRFPVLGAIFLAGLLVGIDYTVGYPFSFSRSVVFFPFFLMGYYRIPEKISKKLGGMYVGMASLALVLCGFFLLNSKNMLFDANVFYQTAPFCDQQAHFFLPDLLQRVFCMLMGIAWIFLLQNIVTAQKVPVLSRVGRYTMPVYLLHGFGLLWLRAHNIFLWREEICILVAVVLAAVICLLLGNSVVYRMLRFTFTFPKRN